MSGADLTEPKTYTALNLIPTIELKPNHKYIVLMPTHLFNDEHIREEIAKFFYGNTPGLIIATDNPETYKLTVIEKPNETHSEENSNRTEPGGAGNEPTPLPPQPV